MTLTIKIRFRRCTVCGQAKGLEHFRKRERGKYGVSSICKPCEAIASREYRKTHPEKAKAARQKWGKENKDKINGYYRKWHDTHKDQHNAKRRERRLAKKLAEVAIAIDCNPIEGVSAGAGVEKGENK